MKNATYPIPMPYTGEVAEEEKQLVYQLSSVLHRKPEQVLEVADLATAMMKVNPAAQRKLEKAREAAEEAAKALAVLDLYLEVLKMELA